MLKFCDMKGLDNSEMAGEIRRVTAGRYTAMKYIAGCSHSHEPVWLYYIGPYKAYIIESYVLEHRLS